MGSTTPSSLALIASAASLAAMAAATASALSASTCARGARVLGRGSSQGARGQAPCYARAHAVMTDGRAGLLEHVGRRHLAEALGDDEVLRVGGLDVDHLEVLAVEVAIRSLTLVGELEEDRRRRWRVGGGGGGTSPLLPTPLIVSVSSTFTARAVRATPMRETVW